MIMDGKLIRSCITKMDRVPEGAAITTIVGFAYDNGTIQVLERLVHDSGFP